MIEQNEMTAVVEETEEIPELEIIAYEKEDIDKLIAFMMGN